MCANIDKIVFYWLIFSYIDIVGQGGFKVVQKIFIHTQTNPLKFFVFIRPTQPTHGFNRWLAGGVGVGM